MELSKRRQNRTLIGIVLLGIFMIFTSGCDKYTRHEVLTFFFTGVPPLEEGEAAEGQVLKKIKGKPIPEVNYFVHGPYAAKQCYQCHALSPAVSFKETGKRGVYSIPLGGQLVGILVTPLKGLCLECHPPKPVRAAHWSDKAPVSEGNCTFCHDPHRSPFRYMLRKNM